MLHALPKGLLHVAESFSLVVDIPACSIGMWQLLNVASLGAFLVTTLCTSLAIFLHWFGLFDVLLHKVDVHSKRNGGEHVAAALKAHGVKYVFTLIGGHISPVLVECQKQGIKIVDTRHEVTCVFAADAVARLSGVVGVACVTAGPGLTNTVTAVKNASMAESPVLLLGGASATILKGRGALQDIDQLALFKPLCKYIATVNRVRDIVPTLRKAIHIAQSGTPGPVFVELPIDALYPYHLVVKEIVAADKPSKSLGMKLVKMYLNHYVNRLFAGAWEPVNTKPYEVVHKLASRESVRECASLIRGAKKPLILLGSQATLPPMKPRDVVSALEKIGAPCFLGGMSRGYLGKNSPIHIRQKRSMALKEADVVICAGAVADFRLSYGRHFSSRSKVVSVNRSLTNMKLNTDTNWKAHLYVHADPGSFLVSLAQELGDFKCEQAWPQELKKRDQEKEVANLKKAQEVPEKHLNPLNVLYHAERALSENSILVADGGDFVGSAAYILRPCGPLKWLDPGAFGTLGVGGGFALGAKLVNPDADVWIIYGDGALGFSIAEFDTFKRHNIPVIALIGNDACWTQIAREQIPMFQSDVACNLSYCDYDLVARGFGGKGFKLDSSCSEKKIDQVLEEAKKISRGGSPVLINCLIGKSNFREGSISV